ncbi:pentatricopeptide repeat-containing protein At3g29230-like [Aristolochia californica]|uniref:pentatricopeptide repeat-containing protein At3g29230-like n=1 Tax=Aristolochia californica TaxID=171875 RepID=UPI0035E000BB
MQKGALVDRQIGANLEEIRKTEDHRKLLDEMAEIKVEYWNPMLRSLMFLERADLARQVFDNMRFRDLMLWNSVIMGYARGVNWTETFDVVFGKTMVDDYGKSSDIEASNLIFSSMKKTNTATWNALIFGYNLNGLACKCMKLFLEMLYKNVVPDFVPSVSVDVGASDLEGRVDRRKLLVCST